MAGPVIDLDALAAEEAARQRLVEEQALAVAQNAAAQQRNDLAASPAMAPPPVTVTPAPPPGPAPPTIAVNPQPAAAPAQEGAPEQKPQGPRPGIAGDAFTVGGGYRPAGEVRAVGDKAIEAFGDAQMMKAQAAESQNRRALGQAMNDVVARDEATGAAEKIATGAQAEIDTLGKKRADYEEQIKRIDADGSRLAATKIDPGRFWAQKSTASQLAMILGAAFSGFAAGRTGGQNQVLSMIQHAIDRDVNAQIQNYEATAKSIEGRRSMVGQLMRETGGDMQQAKAILRDAQIKKALSMADYAAASSKTAHAFQQADTIKMALAEDHAKWMEKAFPWRQAQSGGSKQLVPVRSASGQVVYVSPEKALDYDTKIVEAGAKAQELGLKHGEREDRRNDEIGKRAITLPGGKVRYANRSEDASKLADRAQAYQLVDKAFEDAIQLRKEIKTNLVKDPIKANEQRKHLRRLGMLAAQRLSTSGGQGVLMPGEVPVALEDTTGFTSLQPGSDEALLRGRDIFRRDVENQVGVFAPHRGSVKYVDGRPVFSVEGGGASGQGAMPVPPRSQGPKAK